MKNNLKLIIALIIPIVVLAGIASYHQFLSATGRDHVLAIEGYDPTDLLSGNYIRFRTKYETSRSCLPKYGPVFMCMKPSQYLMFSQPDSKCQEWINGECQGTSFEDGINRFYIPQEKARAIELEVLAGHAQIQLSVGKGSYVVKDLLINGKNWKEMP